MPVHTAFYQIIYYTNTSFYFALLCNQSFVGTLKQPLLLAINLA